MLTAWKPPVIVCALDCTIGLNPAVFCSGYPTILIDTYAGRIGIQSPACPLRGIEPRTSFMPIFIVNNLCLYKYVVIYLFNFFIGTVDHYHFTLLIYIHLISLSYHILVCAISLWSNVNVNVTSCTYERTLCRSG